MVHRILVTDIERGSSIAIMRSLAKQNYDVIGASSKPDAVGFYSRYCSEQFIYSPPEDNADIFVEEMKAYIAENDITLVIPVTDEVILPLSQARSSFESLCKLAIPNPDVLDVTTNKLRTLELAKKHGVPIPKTHVLSTLEDAKQISHQLNFPVVLKPQRSRSYTENHGFDSFQVTYVNSVSDLHDVMSYFEGRSDILLQEYHQGYGVGIELMLFEGEVICAFQHHRLREVPITGGASSFRKSESINPTLYMYASDMLSDLQWTGLAMVEFKMTDDGPILMEINGRVWGSIPLAIDAGMDFPTYLARCYLDDQFTVPAIPHTDYRKDIYARNLETDVIWLFSVLRGAKNFNYIPTPSRIEIIPVLFGYLNPFIYTDIFSWDDPLPGLATFKHIAKNITRKLRKAIRH